MMRPLDPLLVTPVELLVVAVVTVVVVPASQSKRRFTCQRHDCHATHSISLLLTLMILICFASASTFFSRTTIPDISPTSACDPRRRWPALCHGDSRREV